MLAVLLGKAAPWLRSCFKLPLGLQQGRGPCPLLLGSVALGDSRQGCVTLRVSRVWLQASGRGPDLCASLGRVSAALPLGGGSRRRERGRTNVNLRLGRLRHHPFPSPVLAGSLCRRWSAVGESIRVSPAVCSPWPCRGDAVLLFQPGAICCALESPRAFSFAPAHTQLCLVDPPASRRERGALGPLKAMIRLSACSKRHES